MRNLLSVSLLVLGLTAVGLAADVSGQWVAQVPGRQGNTMETTYNFTVDGNKLSGTITTQRGESKISDGKVDGDKISFTQSVEFNGNAFKFMYKGTVSGNEIKMSRMRDGGEGQAQEFVAKKK